MSSDALGQQTARALLDRARTLETQVAGELKSKSGLPQAQSAQLPSYRVVLRGVAHSEIGALDAERAQIELSLANVQRAFERAREERLAIVETCSQTSERHRLRMSRLESDYSRLMQSRLSDQQPPDAVHVPMHEPASAPFVTASTAVPPAPLVGRASFSRLVGSSLMNWMLQTSNRQLREHDEAIDVRRKQQHDARMLDLEVDHMERDCRQLRSVISQRRDLMTQ